MYAALYGFPLRSDKNVSRPIGGSFLTKGGMGGAAQAVWIAPVQYDACRISSLVLIWACFTGLLVALSASPWPFDKADDHAA
jgi:hypothetical protein